MNKQITFPHLGISTDTLNLITQTAKLFKAQELCEQLRNWALVPHPILPPSLISRTVSVDVKHTTKEDIQNHMRQELNDSARELENYSAVEKRPPPTSNQNFPFELAQPAFSMHSWLLPLTNHNCRCRLTILL